MTQSLQHKETHGRQNRGGQGGQLPPLLDFGQIGSKKNQSKDLLLLYALLDFQTFRRIWR